MLVASFALLAWQWEFALAALAIAGMFPTMLVLSLVAIALGLFLNFPFVALGIMWAPCIAIAACTCKRLPTLE